MNLLVREIMNNLEVMIHQVEHDYISMFVMNLRVQLIENLIDLLNHRQYDQLEVRHPKEIYINNRVFSYENSLLELVHQ